MSIVVFIFIVVFFGSFFGGSSKMVGIFVGVVDYDYSVLLQCVVVVLQVEVLLKIMVGDEVELFVQVCVGKLCVVVILFVGLGVQVGCVFFGVGDKFEIVLYYDFLQVSVLVVVCGLLVQMLMQEVSCSIFSVGSLLFVDFKYDIEQVWGLDVECCVELVCMFDSIDVVQKCEVVQFCVVLVLQGGGLFMFYMMCEIEVLQFDVNSMFVVYNSYVYLFVGMGVQFILMVGVDMVLGLLLMCCFGLWKWLCVVLLFKVQLFGSCIVVSMLILLIVFVVIYVVVIVVFGVCVFGSLVGFVFVLVCFVLLMVSFGLFVVVLGCMFEVMCGLVILVMLLMVMFGGVWVLVFIFFEWLQILFLVVLI